MKHELAVPRPSELSPFVQPILQTPGWAALPSGHATEAFMFARLAVVLLGLDVQISKDTSDVLLRQAASITDNRVCAGLHYPMDGICGRLLGETLAEFVLCRAGALDKWRPSTYDGRHKSVGHGELDWTHEAADGAGCPSGVR